MNLQIRNINEICALTLDDIDGCFHMNLQIRNINIVLRIMEIPYATVLSYELTNKEY